MSPYTDFFSEKAKEKDDKALEPPPETQLAGSTNWLSDITGLMCNTDFKKKTNNDWTVFERDKSEIHIVCSSN